MKVVGKGQSDATPTVCKVSDSDSTWLAIRLCNSIPRIDASIPKYIFM